MARYQNEADFELHIRNLLAQEFNEPEFIVLENKTVGDIIICRNGPVPKIFFIEVKYFQLSKGRIGFGNRKGQGIQPEMLSKQPAYLESHVRWLLGSDYHNENGYWLVTPEIIRNYVAGGSIGQKQNNIQEALFREISPLAKDELVSELAAWLKNT